MDPGRGGRGDLHAVARRDDRHRRPAGHPGRAARGVQRRAVGARRLRADPRLAAADLGGTRRPVRPEAALPDRPGHLHPRLAAVRAGSGPADADLVPERPGCRRGDHVRHLPRAAREQFPRPGSRGGVRRCGGRSPAWFHGTGPGTRRHHHHQLELARHLPGQRAHRRPRRSADRLAGGGIEVAAPHFARLGRVHAADGRAGQPDIRAHPGGRAAAGQTPASSPAW